jgi:hypothetical protein
MRFDVPAPENSTVSRLPLAEGYYAFVREENRDLTPQWGTFAVNEALGVLCKSEDGKACSAGSQNTYRDRTWFLVRIARETPESALDIEYGEELSKFLERLDDLEAVDIEKTKAAMENLGDSLTSMVCSKASDKKKTDLKLNCPK